MEVIALLLAASVALPTLVVAGLVLIWRKFSKETRRKNEALRLLKLDCESKQKTLSTMEELIEIKSQTIQQLRS